LIPPRSPAPVQAGIGNPTPLSQLGGGLSLPRIPSRAFGLLKPPSNDPSSPAATEYGAFVEDEGFDDDDDDDDDDAEVVVKPMSTLELKRSLQTSMSISSLNSLKGR
jgi:hypothetical protein